MAQVVCLGVSGTTCHPSVMSHMLPHLPQNFTTRSLSPTSLVFRPSSPSLSCPTPAHSGLDQETLRDSRLSHRYGISWDNSDAWATEAPEKVGYLYHSLLQHARAYLALCGLASPKSCAAVLPISARTSSPGNTIDACHARSCRWTARYSPRFTGQRRSSHPGDTVYVLTGHTPVVSLHWLLTWCTCLPLSLCTVLARVVEYVSRARCTYALIQFVECITAHLRPSWSTFASKNKLRSASALVMYMFQRLRCTLRAPVVEYTFPEFTV